MLNYARGYCTTATVINCVIFVCRYDHNKTKLNKIVHIYTHHNSLATLDGEIVDPEITVKLEMQDLLKVHNAQT